MSDTPEEFDLLTGVQVFMEKAGQLDTIGLPHDSQDPLRVLRRRMLIDPIEGEVSEYVAAEFANDAVEILDGLLDVIVIAFGTALAYFGPEVTLLAAAEVTRSNLSKVHPTITRRADGKVCKPAGWVGPNISGILEGAGWRIGHATSAVRLSDNREGDPDVGVMTAGDRRS